jgi:hypothetical protein
MRQHNAENERVKREYLIYLKAAKGLSEASLDTVVKAIHRFEVSTKFRSLRKFHVEQAVAFRRQLSETDSSETGKPLSKATVLQTLNALRAFFLWLAGQPGYRSRISYSYNSFDLLQLLADGLNLVERCAQMPHDGGSDILRLDQMLLGFHFGVAKPTDVEIVVAGFDFVARKATKPPSLPLILALCLAEWIIAKGFFELREVLHGQWPRLSESLHLVAQIVDPDDFRVRLVGLAAREKYHIGLHALRVENARRQSQDGVEVTKLHHPCAQPAAGVVLEQDVIGHHDSGRSREAVFPTSYISVI